MTQKWNLGHIELGFKVSQISRSPLMEIKLKQGSVSKNLFNSNCAFSRVRIIFTFHSQPGYGRSLKFLQDTGYRMQDTG